MDLRSILTSLLTGSLSNHINTLRRDFLSYFIDHVLKQPYALSTDVPNPNEFKLTLIPSPSNTEDLRSRLDNVSHILDFLSSHLLPQLPELEGIQFTRSLSKPIATSVLNNLLMPSLPSSFGLLPSFLSLLKRAIIFEEDDIKKLLGSPGNEGVIKPWSNGVSGHYERRRRIEILELARKDIVEGDDPKDTFRVIVDDGGIETSRSVVPVQDEYSKDDAWGFDEPAPKGIDEKQNINGDEDVDPADAWGWNEEEDISVEEVPEVEEAPVAEEEIVEDNAWDDPWSDPSEMDSQPQPPPQTISPSFASPKAATLPSKNEKLLIVPKEVIVPKEYYQVPIQTKHFMRMVETVIDEGKLFYASNLFPTSKDTVPAPGTILLQTASSILDLYQALYPVKFAKDLKLPERGMLFSNSCLYMVNTVQQIEDTIYGESILKDRLSECRHHLQLLSESWFNKTIVRMFIFSLLLHY